MAKAKDQGIDTKVAAPVGKPLKVRGAASQPVTGKLGDGMEAMPGAKGKSNAKGGAVKTVKSQPVAGKLDNGSTAMGSGGVIPGKV